MPRSTAFIRHEQAQPLHWKTNLSNLQEKNASMQIADTWRSIVGKVKDFEFKSIFDKLVFSNDFAEIL